MNFPKYIDKSIAFKVLKGRNAKFTSYFHRSDNVKNIFLNVDELFFLHVIKGAVKFQSPNDTFFINAGQSAIVSKSSYIMSESLSNTSDCFSALLFFFEKDFLEHYYFENPTEKNTVSKENHKNILLLKNCKFLQTMAQSVSLLFNKKYESDLIKNLIDLKSKEYDMLYPIINDENYRLKEVIEGNLFSNFSIKELAFLCNMSLSNFKRKFHSIYGNSPGKWIKERKLEHAIKILKTKNFTVNEVSYKCGFRSAAAFSKLFQKKYGVNPSSYI